MKTFIKMNEKLYNYNKVQPI